MRIWTGKRLYAPLLAVILLFFGFHLFVLNLLMSHMTTRIHDDTHGEWAVAVYPPMSVPKVSRST